MSSRIFRIPQPLPSPQLGLGGAYPGWRGANPGLTPDPGEGLGVADQTRTPNPTTSGVVHHIANMSLVISLA